jgi:hypothetical protein
MTELKKWSYTASYRVMLGLEQELGIRQGVHYRPTGHNSARVLSMRLIGVNPHYLPRIRAMQAELTMWAGLPDKTPVRIGQDGLAVTIEIPKPGQFWKRITIDDLESRHFIKRGPVATLGLGLQDEPRRLNFSEPSVAHVFITGQTRSGKTNAERLIGWNLAHNTEPTATRLLIFDVAKKGYNWADFANVAHLAHPIITEQSEADRALCWLTQEIQRRAGERRVTPRIFAVIDELKALADDSKVAASYLSRIASNGGEFGLHLILSTQYPQIQMLGSAELKRNVTTRLCGRVDDAGAATNALGLADSGAETLQGYGDFLLRDMAGLSRLTVAYLQEKHMSQLPRTAETGQLDLPDLDTANQGPRSPDPLEPEQVALALFKPMGINRLAGELSIGSTKARRIKEFADRIRAWAIANGYTECFDSKPYHTS